MDTHMITKLFTGDVKWLDGFCGEGHKEGIAGGPHEHADNEEHRVGHAGRSKHSIPDAYQMREGPKQRRCVFLDDRRILQGK